MHVHLSPYYQKILRDIFVGDYEVIIFGSRAKGTNRKFSDIDICLKSNQKIPDLEMETIKERCTKSNLPYLVDILDYHDINSFFQETINKTGIVFKRAKKGLV